MSLANLPEEVIQAKKRIRKHKEDKFYYIPSEKFLKSKKKEFVPPTRNKNPDIVKKMLVRNLMEQLFLGTDWKAISNWTLHLDNPSPTTNVIGYYHYKYHAGSTQKESQVLGTSEIAG